MPASVAWNTSKRGRQITCLTADPQGNVWIGTAGAGVWRHRANATAAGDTWSQFKADSGLGDDTCCSLVCDRQGRIWAGTLNHGVSVYNGSAWRTYGLTEGPLGIHVNALAVSPVDGDDWGATESGLFCYTLARKTWISVGRADGLPADGIKGHRRRVRRVAPIIVSMGRVPVEEWQ